MARSDTDYSQGAYLIDGQPMVILEHYSYRGTGPFWRGRYRDFSSNGTITNVKGIKPLIGWQGESGGVF